MSFREKLKANFLQQMNAICMCGCVLIEDDDENVCVTFWIRDGKRNFISSIHFINSFVCIIAYRYNVWKMNGTEKNRYYKSINIIIIINIIDNAVPLAALAHFIWSVYCDNVIVVVFELSSFGSFILSVWNVCDRRMCGVHVYSVMVHHVQWMALIMKHTRRKKNNNKKETL